MNGVAPVLIDTSASAPAVWINAEMQGDGTAWDYDGTGRNSILVNSLVLHADSLIPGTGDVVFNSATGAGAIIELEEPMPGATPQPLIVDVDGTKPVNGTIPDGRITQVEHDPVARTFTVSIEIKDIVLRFVGTMSMIGTLTIQY
jgi:hypothetical protein